MISFHQDQANIGNQNKYFYSFYPVDTDDVSRIARALSNYVVSPSVFKNGYDRHEILRKHYRSTTCFVEANWIGLDFDEGVSLSEMLNTFCDVTHVIGTTKSHQTPKGEKPACDRFRVFLKLPVSITSAKEYKDVLRYYVERYSADLRCIDAARFFWPCREIVSAYDAGDTIELKKKELVYDSNFDTNPYRKSKKIPPFVKHWLEFGVPQGEKNNTCFKIGIWLTKCGFSLQEIVALIMNSPIPNKTLDVEKEVFNATRSGVKLALRELLEEQEKKSLNF